MDGDGPHPVETGGAERLRRTEPNLIVPGRNQTLTLSLPAVTGSQALLSAQRKQASPDVYEQSSFKSVLGKQSLLP